LTIKPLPEAPGWMMGIDVILVFGISMAVLAVALRRGGSPEKLAAGLVALNICTDLLIRQWVGEWNFSTFSSSRFAIDLGEFSLLFFLAYNANRVWPIFSAAAQLVAVGGSLAVLQGQGGMQAAYWAITQLPLLGQLIALALGTFFHVRRLSVIGPYRDWRPAYSYRR
jgi:hypothetical protein